MVKRPEQESGLVPVIWKITLGLALATYTLPWVVQIGSWHSHNYQMHRICDPLVRGDLGTTPDDMNQIRPLLAYCRNMK